MKIHEINDWSLTPKEAVKLQKELSRSIVSSGRLPKLNTVAGVDVAYTTEFAIGAAVVLDYPSMEVIDSSVATMRVNMPYIPGLLSFREIPVLLKALEKLRLTPDVFIVDGLGPCYNITKFLL